MIPRKGDDSWRGWADTTGMETTVYRISLPASVRARTILRRAEELGLIFVTGTAGTADPVIARELQLMGAIVRDAITGKLVRLA